MESYLRSNKRQSLFSDDDLKKVIYSFYLKYQKHLSKLEAVDLNISEIDLSNKADLLIVDESQDFSPIAIRNLSKIARGVQHAFLINSNQSLDDTLSTRPYIIKILSQQGSLRHHQLLENYGNPSLINYFANSLLRIKNFIIGGVSDKFEYVKMQKSHQKKQA